MLRAGLILRWHTSALHHAPKRKRFICACPVQGWFFLINSRDLWGRSLALAAANCGGALDHDSFVELRAVIPRNPADLAAALLTGRADMLGALDRWALRQLQAAVAAAETLTGEQIAAIERAIAETLAAP